MALIRALSSSRQAPFWPLLSCSIRTTVQNMNKPQIIRSKNPKIGGITMRQKLQKAVAEYGSTVIVFHVGISLMSLGTCYLLVSSGLDVEKIMHSMGISDGTVHKIASNAGTFAVAYAFHKLFAPARIMVTITATPFIVRYLRNIGVLGKVK